MKINPIILASAALAGLSFMTGSAMAQDATAPAEAEGEGTVAAEGSLSAEAEAPEVAPAAEEPAEAPAEEPVEEPAEEPVAAAAPVEAAEEAPEEEEGGASLFVFADAWMGFQTAKSGSAFVDPASGEYAGRSGGGVYAFNGPNGTAESGFGINWLGMDLGYDGGMWAVNGSLRFGDAVATYGTGTLGPVTNAYVSLRPVEGLSIDAGIFTTIYGAEVAESWANLNYTRGELYYNMQPFWHTGLRAEYATGNFVVRALAVNDANNSNLGSGAVNLGLQAGYDNGTFGVIAGALQSLKPESSVNGAPFPLDTFIDVVATVNAGDFSMVGNFDINLGYTDGSSQFWGASLAAGYSFVPAFGIALRGEYLDYVDADATLVTGTLTFDVKPIPDVENVILRWDNRIEVANEEVYLNLKADDTTKTWFGSTFGLVAYADLL